MPVEVTALAVIGRDQRLLVVRRRSGGPWVLPDAPVDHAEPVETVLRQAVAEEFSVVATFVSFLTVIEHGDVDNSGAVRHGLSVVFDVGIAGQPAPGAGRELGWVSKADLAELELRPPGLLDGLLSGRFDDGDRWLPWRPYIGTSTW